MAAEDAGVAYIWFNVAPTRYLWTLGRVRWDPNERDGVAYIGFDVLAGVPETGGGALGENEWGEDG